MRRSSAPRVKNATDVDRLLRQVDGSLRPVPDPDVAAQQPCDAGVLIIGRDPDNHLWLSSLQSLFRSSGTG
eukprot:2711066-Pyramimonas_sp.AAC.1